jgi:hypothetical protein
MTDQSAIRTAEATFDDKNQAIGIPNTTATITNRRKSFSNIFHKPSTEAPNTFLILISRARWIVAKDASPKQPLILKLLLNE